MAKKAVAEYWPKGRGGVAARGGGWIKTMCFEWFHFLYLFTDSVSGWKDVKDILVSFGEGPEDRLEML